MGGQPDGDGSIDADKLISTIKNEFEMTINIEELIQAIDEDGSGEIEFDEFLAMMTAKISSKNSRAEIETVWKLFDLDRTGEVSLENMKQVAADLGEEASPAELQEMVMRADLDKDGSFTFDDFYAVMTKKTFS